jgi:hypothetical protein
MKKIMSVLMLLVLTGCGKYGQRLLGEKEPEQKTQMIQMGAEYTEIPTEEITDINRRIFLDPAFKTAKSVSVRVFISEQQSVALPHINQTLDIEANYMIDRTMVSVYNVKSAIPNATKIRIEYIK